MTRTHDATIVAPLTDELARVGRYVIIDRIGAGGMGVVYRAYDPELDRKVAVKFLLPGRGSGQERLAREARAMARVSHPNVVPVHDVGSVDDRLFIAMEFVDGQSLADWLRAQPRGTQEIVTIFRGAAAGLAAAHEVGVVHRDFKPDNVLVDRKGRPQVTDFGLAAGDLAPTVETDGSHDTDRSHDPPELTRLTRAGAAVGTPAYMAPEQFEGKTVDARSDQFSFCVALWEALWGERPFKGASAGDLAWAVTHGEIRVPATPTPGWLYQVLVRGLSTDPAKRWPSMTTLLTELELGHTRTRRRRIGYAFLGAILVASGVTGTMWYDRARQAAQAEEIRTRQVSQCEDEGAAIESAWNDTVRSDVRAAFVATGVSFADVAADKVMPWIDKQVGEWQRARTEVCLDTHLHGILNADTAERAWWCLDERYMELESLIAELSRADRQTVERAVPVASTLRQVATCRMVDALANLPAPPHERREDARVVLSDLSHANSLERIGAYGRGVETAKRALASAEALAWPPLTSAAQLRLGKLLERAGRYSEAESMLETAFFTAAKGGAPDVAFSASVELIYTVGYKLGRYADGLRWSKHADVILAAIGDAERVRTGSRLNSLAIIYTKAGQYDESIELFQQVLNISAAVFGEEHPEVAKALNNLGLVHYYSMNYAVARDLHMRALSIRRSTLGDEHVDVAGSLDNVGTAYLGLGEIARAMPVLAEALAIRERVLGAEHPEVALSLEGLAVAYMDAADYASARPYLERSLAIKARIFDDEHGDLATTKSSLANVYRELDLMADAERLFTEALRVREKVLGPDHAGVAATLVGFAKLRRKQGRVAEARRMYERGLAIDAKVRGEDHEYLETFLRPLAEIALEQGRDADALELAERAVRVLENTRVLIENKAYAGFLVAQALWNLRRDRSRAVQLANTALSVYRSVREPDPSNIREIEQWLAARAGGSP